MEQTIREALAAHWRALLAQGTLMLVLGVLALVAPVKATIAVDLYVGVLFLLGGVVGLVAMYFAAGRRALRWSVATACLSSAVGILLVWKPAAGALSLTVLMTAFFVAEGVYQAATSIAYRKALGPRWGWMLASGIADLALATVVVVAWPASTGWALGIVAGVSLISSGWAIAMAALAGREMARAAHPAGPARA